MADISPPQDSVLKAQNRLPLLIAGLYFLILFLGSAGISYLIIKGRAVKKLTPADFLPRHTAGNIADMKRLKDIYTNQPITKIDGKLLEISGDIISVVHHYVFSGEMGRIGPGQQPMNVIFQFRLTPKTEIYRSENFVPYLFTKHVSNMSEAITASELKTNQFVVVTTDEDMRAMSTQMPYMVKSIQVTRISNTIRGSISKVSGNTFTIRTTPPQLPASFPLDTKISNQEYTVHITPATEISMQVSGNPIHLSHDQLANGTTVTVYSGEDTAVDTQLTALLIVPEGITPVSSPSLNLK